MRCLYCGKQLALFRRLTGGGEFCSDAHKKAYHEEYNRLAMTRLIAAQSRIEDKKPIASPSTMQIAAGDRSGRALTLGAPDAVPGRRNQAGSSRMLDAPAPEATPPPVAPFQSSPLEARAGKIPAYTRSLDPVSFVTQPAGIAWSPPFSKPPEDPPQAPAQELQSALKPSPPSPRIAATPTPISTSLAPQVPALPVISRKLRTLPFRPQMPLGLGPYLPHIEGDFRLADRPEPFRFAVMLFGSQAVRLPLLRPQTPVQAAARPGTGTLERDTWDWDQFGKSPSPAPVQSFVSSSVSAPTAAAPAPPDVSEALQFENSLPFTPDDPRETAHRRPPSMKLKVASMAAAQAQEAPRPLAPEPPKPIAAPSESRTGPRLPSLTAARKGGGSLPSILQNPEPKPPQSMEEPKTSLWASLKKYISK